LNTSLAFVVGIKFVGLTLMVSEKVGKCSFPSFRRKPESSNFNAFWMPVADPVFSGDQVRHDDFETFYRIVNII